MTLFFRSYENHYLKGLRPNKRRIGMPEKNKRKINDFNDIYVGDDSDEQFEISDGRSVEEVYQAILGLGLQPVMSDYIYV